MSQDGLSANGIELGTTMKLAKRVASTLRGKQLHNESTRTRSSGRKIMKPALLLLQVY